MSYCCFSDLRAGQTHRCRPSSRCCLSLELGCRTTGSGLVSRIELGCCCTRLSLGQTAGCCMSWHLHDRFRYRSYHRWSSCPGGRCRYRFRCCTRPPESMELRSLRTEAHSCFVEVGHCKTTVGERRKTAAVERCMIVAVGRCTMGLMEVRSFAGVALISLEWHPMELRSWKKAEVRTIAEAVGVVAHTTVVGVQLEHRSRTIVVLKLHIHRCLALGIWPHLRM